MAKKTKYYYNSDTLKYEKVKHTWKQQTLLGLLFMLTSIGFGFLLSSLYVISDSPKEKILRKEVSKMALQYEILQERLQKMDIVLQYLKDRDEHIYRVIFEAAPSNHTTELLTNNNHYSNLEGYYNSAILKETSKLLDQIAQKIYLQSKSFDELHSLTRSRVVMLSSIPGIQPVDSRKIKGAISGFGYRIHPIYKIVKMHTGIDFTAPVGTPVYATGNGVVKEAGVDRAYGNKVIINHGYGYQTLYAHLNRFKTRTGQRIKRGDLIGYVGSTGSSTGPHLHYEVIKGKQKVNPINFFYNDLTPTEYQNILAISSKANQSFD